MHITGGLMVAETPDELQLLHDKQTIEAGGRARDARARRARSCARSRRTSPTISLGAIVLPAARATRTRCSPRRSSRCARSSAARVDPHARGGDGDRGRTRTAARTASRSRPPRARSRAHRVVNAAGAWANELAALIGLRFPIRADGLHLNVTEPREQVLEPMVQHIGRRLTLKQSANDTFIIGGGWPAATRAARRARYSTMWESAAGNAAVAVRVMPSLADVRVVRTWSGVMAFTDDLSPIVGESAALPGYHALIATTGFTLGPLMARLLAEHMASPDPRPLPPAFAVDRGATHTTTT